MFHVSESRSGLRVKRSSRQLSGRFSFSQSRTSWRKFSSSGERRKSISVSRPGRITASRVACRVSRGPGPPPRYHDAYVRCKLTEMRSECSGGLQASTDSPCPAAYPLRLSLSKPHPVAKGDSPGRELVEGSP